jgi:hypothetical protein
MLIYLDGILAGKKEDFQVKSALVASSKYDPEILFADVFGSGSTTTPSDSSSDPDPIDDSDTDFDYSGVKWELPSDGDMAALAQLRQVMSQNTQVTLTGDIEDDVPALPMDFTVDDREWL